MASTPTLSTYHEASDTSASTTVTADMVIEEFEGTSLDGMINNSTITEKDITEDGSSTADGYITEKLEADLNEQTNGRNGYEVNEQTAKDIFGEAWNGNFSEVSTQVTASLSNIATTTASIATLSELLKSTEADLTQQAKNLIYSKFNSQISVIYSKYSDITRWINNAKAFANFNISYDSIKDAIMGSNSNGMLQALNDTLDTADKFLSNVDDFSGLIDKCVQSVEDWFEPIVKAGSDTIETITTTITDVGEGISGFSKKLTEFTDKLSNEGVSSALSSFPSSVLSKLIGIDIVQDLLILPIKIVALVPTLITQLTTFPKAAPTSLIAIKNLISYFKNVLSTIGKLTSTVNKMVNSINTVKNNIEKLVSNVSKGNWTGILAVLIAGGTNFIQNIPTFKAVYPMNQAHRTPGGILFQIDNSGSVGGKNGLSVTMPDNSNADFDANGNLNLHPQGNMQVVTENDTQFYSKKNITLDAAGDMKAQVKNINLSSKNDITVASTNNLSINGKSINFSGTTGGVNVSSALGLNLSSSTDVALSGLTGVGIKTQGLLTIEANAIVLKCTGAYTDFVGGVRTIATAGASNEVCGGAKDVMVTGIVTETVGGAYNLAATKGVGIEAGGIVMIGAESSVTVNSPIVNIGGGVINLL